MPRQVWPVRVIKAAASRPRRPRSTPLVRSAAVGRAIVEKIEGKNFRRGEVAVFDALRQRVFVNRLAEISDVIGQDAFIVAQERQSRRRVGGRFRLFLGGKDQFARRGREADLNRVRVALQDDGPLPPSGAVALVNDDMAEGIFRGSGEGGSWPWLRRKRGQASDRSQCERGRCARGSSRPLRKPPPRRRRKHCQRR